MGSGEAGCCRKGEGRGVRVPTLTGGRQRPMVVKSEGRTGLETHIKEVLLGPPPSETKDDPGGPVCLYKQKSWGLI